MIEQNDADPEARRLEAKAELCDIAEQGCFLRAWALLKDCCDHPERKIPSDISKSLVLAITQDFELFNLNVPFLSLSDKNQFLHYLLNDMRKEVREDAELQKMIKLIPGFDSSNKLSQALEGISERKRLFECVSKINVIKQQYPEKSTQEALTAAAAAAMEDSLVVQPSVSQLADNTPQMKPDQRVIKKMGNDDRIVTMIAAALEGIEKYKRKPRNLFNSHLSFFSVLFDKARGKLRAEAYQQVLSSDQFDLVQKAVVLRTLLINADSRELRKIVSGAIDAAMTERESQSSSVTPIRSVYTMLENYTKEYGGENDAYYFKQMINFREIVNHSPNANTNFQSVLSKKPMSPDESHKRELADELGRYINEIDSNKRPFRIPFFFQNAQAKNRKANYAAAKDLHDKLLENVADTNMTIVKIFEKTEIERVRQAHGATRGIHSAELNRMIAKARKM